MRFRCAALTVFLTLPVAWDASAQDPSKPPKCPLQDVTLQEGEAVPAPEGYGMASASFYNTEDWEELPGPGQVLPLRLGGPAVLLLSEEGIAKAQSLKESSTKAPDKFMLLWRSPAGERCVQSFSVLFDRPQRVLLDATGVEGRYVNPVRPVPIDGRPLQFFNNTGDRTFVVTIPFVYTAAEAASSYAVADYDRGRQVLSDIVCKALGGECTHENKISELEGLRVLLESVGGAKPVSLGTECATMDQKTHLKNGSCIAEILFWTATCRIEVNDLVDFARLRSGDDRIRGLVKKEAGELLKRMFESGSAIRGNCPLETARSRQSVVIGELDPDKLKEADTKFLIENNLPVPQGDEGEVVPFSYEAKSAGLKSRFGETRIDIAKRALAEEIRTRMGFAPAKADGKSGLEVFFARLGARLDQQNDEEDGFTPEIRSLFDDLQNRRDFLAKEARKAKRARMFRREDPDEGTYYACLIREVEAAAKLLASYSPNSGVPYSGIPETIRGGRVQCEDFRGEAFRNKGEDYARRMAQRFEALSEQGIEITNCQSTATGATCSATATIPPYRWATFSRAILAHHPQARISFAVSFFGDTEIPGNPIGYVTRSDATAADEKPKSAFVLQLGGDSSTSFDPDQTVSGQLRHSAATGALSFQYTGPVEASATVQFKTGDLGGTASQTQATQYQAKVYGPDRLVLQYGKIPFAKPSSGIAINVFGEGIQLIMGPASFSYVVLRESAEGAATPENKDSALALFQYRNIPLNRLPRKLGFLRTLDLAAVYGEDRRDSAVNPPIPRPYTYLSGGGELRWGSRKFSAFGGSVAGYYSERHVEPAADPDDPMLPLSDMVDGEAWVGLLRVSWTRLPVPKLNQLRPEVRPPFGLSALVGYGTGDEKDTADKDEGYLGESAAFSNDVLFLSRVANSVAFSRQLGMGLSNKRYAGLQMTTWRLSLLALISKMLGAEKDIASRSTIVTLHAYEFNQDVQGRQWAGKEANLQFNLEAPKNIQWVLGGAYYWTSTAVGNVIGVHKNLWSATAKLSIKLSNL